MADKKRINLMVNEEKKTKWEQEAEENVKYSNLSDLIRQSVEHELAGAHEPRQNPEETTSDTPQPGADALEDVTDTLARIESSLSDLTQRVNEIEKEMGTSGEAADLQNAIFEVLPTGPESDEHGHVEGTPADWGVTVDDLADETGTTPEEVEDAMTQLQNVTQTIQGASGGPDNETYYWRTE